MKTKRIISVMAALILLIGLSTTFLHAQETIITKNELPKNAQLFISKYFGNQTISYIKKDKELVSSDYEVKYSNGMEVKFDSSGNWEEIDGNHQNIPTGFISKKITSYIAKQFPGNHITKIEKQSFGKQKVKISNGLELQFNSSGNFVKIDD